MPLVETGAAMLKSLVSTKQREEAGEIADDVGRKARKALETQEMMRDIISPEPKGPAAGSSSAKDGYGVQERRALDRLIDSDQ